MEKGVERESERGERERHGKRLRGWDAYARQKEHSVVCMRARMSKHTHVAYLACPQGDLIFTLSRATCCARFDRFSR
eukprot:5770821-Pleurochrysis_carterae.AAC.1